MTDEQQAPKRVRDVKPKPAPPYIETVMRHESKREYFTWGVIFSLIALGGVLQGGLFAQAAIVPGWLGGWCLSYWQRWEEIHEA